MLSISVGSILDRAAFFLNDVDRQYFTNTVLLYPFSVAYDDMKEEFYDHDIRVTGEVSATFEITTSMFDIGGPTGPPLPSNFVVPVTLWERGSGTKQTITIV